jgi:predicted ribosome quality control (RQC) complex YloA/Tae2 family protein
VLAGQAGTEALTHLLDRAGAPETHRGQGAQGRGKGHPTPLPYHRFRSSSGIEIRVGRGARHNDALTFHHARPGEIWLHVREAPGAHVVLRWEGEGSPPARDLEEAAMLAALHSDARHAGLVPVDWTRRKHVRKPRKAAPGAVVPAQVRTVFVEPDPEAAKRLRWSRDGG